MPTLLTLNELDVILQNCISSVLINDPFSSGILKTMYNTGLRANEVIEVNRWNVNNSNSMAVTLEKGDYVRKIDNSLIDNLLLPYYIAGTDNPVYTYSSILWRINKTTPKITVNGDTRRTSAHLFRYYFIKKLYSEGKTPSEIKEIICHKSQNSTNMYIFDNLYLH